jgi:hypothetical protein
MRRLKLLIIALLLVTAILLMYDDIIDSRGTPSLFDPAELTDLNASHEQFVLLAFVLVGAMVMLPLEYIRQHPLKTAAGVAAAWLIVVALAVVAGLARWPPCAGPPVC